MDHNTIRWLRVILRTRTWWGVTPTPFRVHCPRAGLPVVVTRRPDGLMVKQRLPEPSERSGRRTNTDSNRAKVSAAQLRELPFVVTPAVKCGADVCVKIYSPV